MEVFPVPRPMEVSPEIRVQGRRDHRRRTLPRARIIRAEVPCRAGAGKGRHERFLPISDETWATIGAYLSEHPATSGPLVRSYNDEWRPIAHDTVSTLVSQ